MRFAIRFTEEAQQDLERLYDWLLERANVDFDTAKRARQAIQDGISVLQMAPLSCRKADSDNPFLRELVIGFGASGCVLLFEIENDQTGTVLAARHQREDDYH